MILVVDDLPQNVRLLRAVLEPRGYVMISAMMYLEFNMRDPMFRDVKVREAFAHAINKAQLVDVVWLGSGTPATGPISEKLTQFY